MKKIPALPSLGFAAGRAGMSDFELRIYDFL
jgi:hypothetical protein